MQNHERIMWIRRLKSCNTAEEIISCCAEVAGFITTEAKKEARTACLVRDALELLASTVAEA